MTTSTIRAALDAFWQAANRGTAVYLSSELVQELRDALEAEPETSAEAPAIRIALERLIELEDTASTNGADLDTTAWDDAVATGRAALKAEPDAEALAARPLLEQVAAMAGAQTVGQVTAISNRAAAWLRANPPGQPVAIEPRGCPTPGACSCVKPAPLAPEPLNGYLQGYDAGRRDAAADAQQAADAAQDPPAPEPELPLSSLMAQELAEAEQRHGRFDASETIERLGRCHSAMSARGDVQSAALCQHAATLLQQQTAELAALRRVPVGKWEDGFMGGVCAALATTTAHGDSVIWREIVRSVGVDNALNYAANVNPEDWELAGFSKYAQPELGKDKPLPAPQVGEGEA